MPIEVRGSITLLMVFDMPASLRFYRDTLGFEVVADSGQGDESGWVMLELNGTPLMLNTAYDDDERPPAPDPARIAAHRDTLLFFGCPDVDAAYAHLRAQGVDVEEPHVSGYGYRGIFVIDPDGYELNFHWPVTPPSE